MGWGDELMVTGKVREMQEKDPRKVCVIYEKMRWHSAFDNNPRIARPEEQGNFQYLRGRQNGLRPYMVKKEPMQWRWRAYQPARGELYFSDEERVFGERFKDRIIFEPMIKANASPNKNWGKNRWHELYRLANSSGLRITQLGESNRHLIGMSEFIETPTVRLAAAIVACARAVVVHEGGLHHTAAALNRPAVVIYGGYISPEVTGYPDQKNLFAGEGLGCGMRSACPCCTKAMAAITPQMVFEKLKEVI